MQFRAVFLQSEDGQKQKTTGMLPKPEVCSAIRQSGGGGQRESNPVMQMMLMMVMVVAMMNSKG